MSFLLSVALLTICWQGPINEVIENSKLQELLKSDGVQLIDVRTPEEWSYGIIEGATKIDYYDPDFMQKVSELQKDQPVVLYCAAGGRSHQAANRLKEAGFQEIYDLGGGFRGWVAEGLPSVK
ncbi:MAG: rhodanese-like domain-containing protein [Bacteroidota bacterium]